jgi:hydrogenase maturation factor HypF (carbamoyltransferase family)
VLLARAGFEVLLDASVPLNDGGLAAGQLLELAGRSGTHATDADGIN